MKRPMFWVISVAAGLVALFSGVAALRSSSFESTWKELDSVAELREQFNEDEGSTRIVLLLSPT